MNNKKGTKRALLTSLLMLLLSCSMFVGSTFAWFTDSVTSSGNIIKSGTLDVTMEWKDATTIGAQQTYKDASEGAIFNYDKWEPGYVEAKNVKISNVGTLALKYNLNIAANGEVSELADAIDVYFAEGEYTLANREMTELTWVGTLSDILEGMPVNMSGDLEANTTATVTIALKMQESAGNEYQNLAIGSDFSIILMATQENVEKDSFDENYDDIEVPDKDIKVIDGNTYYYLNDGNVVLVSVPYGNVGTTFTVREDVTIIGASKDKGSQEGPVFSKYSPVESISIPEGVKEINARAINMPTLTSVNFPSTLEYIGAQAFRTTGMSTLTIPASVTEIAEGAFRDMANLTTVTVEGNVAFEKFVFRSCPKLETIYLLGDDVTFASGQFATHADTGDANGITVYVKNATVAANLLAAQPTGGYEIKILGEATDGSDATAVSLAKDDAALDTAIQNGATTLVLGSGEYTMPAEAAGKTLTIVGNGETKVIAVDSGASEGDIDYSLRGSTATFENVVLDVEGTYFAGYAGLKATYNNCVINGSLTLYDNTEFNNCTFNISGDAYNLWTWGAEYATFNGCTFNCDGKALLLYGTANTKLAVNDCIFNDNGDDTVTNKAAIEIGNDYGKSYDVTINNTTVNGFAISKDSGNSQGGTNSNSNVWGNKNRMPVEKLNVVIDGVDVY